MFEFLWQQTGQLGQKFWNSHPRMSMYWWAWGRNPLPVLGSLFSTCCRVGIILTSIFCYFAVLGNYFVYSVMFHFGSSLNFDLKSVLSMAERILTSWKHSWSMFNFCQWVLALCPCSVDLRKLVFVGWEMRLQGFGRKILSVNVPSSCGVVLV